MSISPRLSVVIPTADRSETLYYTLQTVLSQTYDNLQIIVSDNNSSDRTREVVTSFSDKRLEYVNTGKRIGMSSNWDFGLGHVTGDYVFFLGDDDGLLPDACDNVASLIQRFDVRAVTWQKPNYSWPSSYVSPNYLTLKLDRQVFTLTGRYFLAALALNLTSYGRLPNLYTSFVSMNVVRAVKGKSGLFFRSVTPDVYSGIVLAEPVGRYIYSFRPFSVNGGSAKSNGQSDNRPDNFSMKHFEELDLPMNGDIPAIRGSISSCVAEAYLQAYALGLITRIPLNRRGYLKAIFVELMNHRNEEIRTAGLSTLLKLALGNRVKKDFQSQLEQRRTEGSCSGKKPEESPNSLGELRLKVDTLGVQTIVDCVRLVGQIFGSFQLPEKITHADPGMMLIARLLRKNQERLEIIRRF